MLGLNSKFTIRQCYKRPLRSSKALHRQLKWKKYIKQTHTCVSAHTHTHTHTHTYLDTCLISVLERSFISLLPSLSQLLSGVASVILACSRCSLIGVTFTLSVSLWQEKKLYSHFWYLSRLFMCERPTVSLLLIWLHFECVFFWHLLLFIFFSLWVLTHLFLVIFSGLWLVQLCAPGSVYLFKWGWMAITEGGSQDICFSSVISFQPECWTSVTAGRFSHLWCCRWVYKMEHLMAVILWDQPGGGVCQRWNDMRIKGVCF